MSLRSTIRKIPKAGALGAWSDLARTVSPPSVIRKLSLSPMPAAALFDKVEEMSTSSDSIGGINVHRRPVSHLELR